MCRDGRSRWENRMMVLGRILAVLAMTMIAISQPSAAPLGSIWKPGFEIETSWALEFALSSRTEILGPVKHSKQVQKSLSAVLPTFEPIWTNFEITEQIFPRTLSAEPRLTREPLSSPRVAIILCMCLIDKIHSLYYLQIHGSMHRFISEQLYLFCIYMVW